MITPDRSTFRRFAANHRLVPVARRIMSDQFTPVLAYRRLVTEDERTAPSFLFESVEGGDAVGRYSFLGARPRLEVTARGHDVVISDHHAGTERAETVANPLEVPRRLSRAWPAVSVLDATGLTLPGFTGGWVGYAGYDVVRYLEPERLGFDQAPPDDRGLADLSFGLYDEVAIFDHVHKMLVAVVHVWVEEGEDADLAYDRGCRRLDEFVTRLATPGRPLPACPIDLDLAQRSPAPLQSNLTRDAFEDAVRRGQEYIAAGDAFQIVLSQRFRRETHADPFEVYRALRIVNPSPYMIYMQTPGAILVASSPEILCRCAASVVTSRPLAGTRPRGATPEEDGRLEAELRADEKERAEHVMLVDLGRNDLGRVCEPRTIALERVLDVERYSHVMHLSSSISGRLRPGLDAWDALARTLPVGTVSGAPKVRAMQIIDELEPTRRGPYAGGIGYIAFGGDMDIAIALRTMVVPTSVSKAGRWVIDLQAGAGVVADSVPAGEYEETVSKAAALSRAIDLAEAALPIEATT